MLISRAASALSLRYRPRVRDGLFLRYWKREPTRPPRSHAAAFRCVRPAWVGPVGGRSAASMAIGERTPGSRCPGVGRQVEPHAARDDLRIGEHLGDRVDRAGRHAGRFEPPAAVAIEACGQLEQARDSVPRLATRAGLVAKRSSCAIAGSPRIAHNLARTGRRCRPAMSMWPSATGNTW